MAKILFLAGLNLLVKYRAIKINVHNILERYSPE